jgi:hypothetical protein
VKLLCRTLLCCAVFVLCCFVICSVLYGDELKAALKANPKHMRLDVALSLEQQNAQGGPEYVQVRGKEQDSCSRAGSWVCEWSQLHSLLTLEAFGAVSSREVCSHFVQSISMTFPQELVLLQLTPTLIKPATWKAS